MKTALVMGIETSGLAASTLLAEKGFEVRKYDDKLDIENNWKNKKPEEIYENLNLVVLSPGIPHDHPIIIGANERNIPVVSELDLGATLLNSKIIMVTGTNGKTTTVDMIGKGLAILGKKAKTMGNIGFPVTRVVSEKTELDYAVIEASSFQLEFTSQTRPMIAALLNLAPDHIDRYDSYADYVRTKKRVFMNQTADDFAILNYDSREIMSMVKDIKAQKLFVSLREPVGAFYIKNNYYYCDGEPLVSVKESKLRGEHNRFNTMVALNVMKILGGKREQFISLIRDYKLLPHRVEYVGTINGKSFYNDSKGTNISATVAAVNAVEGKVGLILGGSDKHEEFCDFFDALPDKVTFVAVTGGNEEKIYAAAMKVGFREIEIYPTLSTAIAALYSMDAVDTILFSPASASFDRYRSYEERGEKYKELVYAIR